MNTPEPVFGSSKPKAWFLLSRAIYFGFFAACLILKLWLVRSREVVVADSDDYGYAVSAMNVYWHNAYNVWLQSRQPGYPVFVAISFLLGIPLRLWIEFWFCLACWYCAHSIARRGFSRITECATFAACFFHPQSLDLFDHVLSDSFYTVCVMFFIGSIVALIVDPTRKTCLRASLIGGIAMGAAWNTRPETILLLATAFLGVMLTAWNHRKAGSWQAWLKVVVQRWAPVALIVIVMTYAILYANYRRFGFWGTCDLQMPGFKNFNAALMRIKPERPIEFAPISMDMRQKAYAVSPSFARLKPYLENDSDNPFSETVKRLAGKEHEYGSWFVWGLKWATERANMASSAPKLDEFYQKAANEINAALDAGKIPARRTFGAAFLDPEFGIWVPKLFPNMVSEFRKIVSFVKAGASPNASDEGHPKAETFDLAAMRRTAVVAGFGKNHWLSRIWMENTVSVLNYRLNLIGMASLLILLLVCWFPPRIPSFQNRLLILGVLIAFFLMRLFVMTGFTTVTLPTKIGLAPRYIFSCRIVFTMIDVFLIATVLTYLRVAATALTARARRKTVPDSEINGL